MTTLVLDDTIKQDIQGFITSAYGHTYFAGYLFLAVDDAEKARAWLKGILPNVLSAESWRKESGAAGEKAPKIYPREIINIAFTYKGLRAIGLSDLALKSFPAQMQQGMTETNRALQLGDTQESDPANWEVGGTKNPDVHILLILHAGMTSDDSVAIERFMTAQKEALSGVSVVHEEVGYRRADDKELFGFKDGIAQPKVEGVNIRNRHDEAITNPVKAGEFILGYKTAYGLYPTVPVVPADEDPNDILPDLSFPHGTYPTYRSMKLKDLGKHGTFVVYRKLYQDVSKFWRFIMDEVKRIDGQVTAERVTWLASKFVGRKPNGKPLVPDEAALRDDDDFMFARDDGEGLHCPFGSHIRRSNPRDQFLPTDEQMSITTVDKHRILRRGKLYGKSLFDLDILNHLTDEGLEQLMQLQDDGVDRGLHFFCVNANIERQFEFLQDAWSNNPSFNALYGNKDPITGDNEREGQTHSRMIIPHKPAPIRTKSLPRFVHVRGGAYMFMPSMTALRYIANI